MKLFLILSFSLLLLFSSSLQAKDNICPYPVLKNIQLRVNLEKHLFESAYNRCKVKVPELPCLISFEKVATDDYVAICGAELSKKKLNSDEKEKKSH